MLSSDEPSNTDVDELLESWINATAPEAPEAAAGLGSTALSPAHAPPRVSGLLQGASLRDINPPLTSAANAGARLTNHPGATEAAKASSQVIGPSTNLDPEQELKAKRGKHTVDGVPDSAPRNSEVNRRAQKKFRAKQKERFEQMQTRLKDTATELKKKDEMIAQLRTTQQQLHRRNVVLESLYKTGNMPPPSASAAASVPALAFPVAPARCYPTSTPDPGPSLLQMSQNRSPPVAAVVLPGAPAPFPEMLGVLNRQYLEQEIGGSGYITLSLLGGACQMSMVELSKMRVPDFAKLWTAYIRSLAPALTSPRRDPSARGFTRQVAKELGHLIECVKLVNMDCFHALVEGKMNPALACTVNLDAAFYEKLTRNLRLNKEQHEDITYLRRLYFTRRAVLALEREGLEDALASANSNLRSIPLPNERLSEMSATKAKLQHVAEEDCRVYFRVLTAIRRKVLTAEQFALICIHSYPYISSGDQWMCAWKSDCCHESREMLVAAAAVFDMRAEWDDLEALLAEPVSDGLASKRVSRGQTGKQAAAAPPAGFNLRDTPPNRHLAAVKSAPASSGHLPQHSWLNAAADMAPGGPSGGSPMLCDDPSNWSAAASDPLLPKSKAPRVADSITFSATPALTPHGSSSFSAQQSRPGRPAAMLPTSLPSSETADWTQPSTAPSPMSISRHHFRSSLGVHLATTTDNVLSAHLPVVSLNTAASNSVGSKLFGAHQSSEYMGGQSHRSSGFSVAPTSVSTPSGLLGGDACSWEAAINTILAASNSLTTAQSPSFIASAATVPAGSTSFHAHQSSAQLSGAQPTSWGATMDCILATSNPPEAAQSSWSTSPALSDPTLLAINPEGAQHCVSGLPNANLSASIPFAAMQQSWLPPQHAVPTVGGNLHDSRPSTWVVATRTASMHSQRGLTNSPTVTTAFGMVSGSMHNNVTQKSWASEGPETGTPLSITPGMNGVPILHPLAKLNAGDAAHGRVRSSSACLDSKEKHHYNLSMY